MLLKNTYELTDVWMFLSIPVGVLFIGMGIGVKVRITHH
jgi:hypothetical protein